MKLACAAVALHLVAAGAAGAAVFDVTNTDDAGPGSLRQAILDANANDGPDTIRSVIPGDGLHVIVPLSELPALLGPTTLTALTEAGASCASWPPTLRVILDGFQAGPNASGLRVLGDDSIVLGFVVRNFSQHGIEIQNNENARLRCNMIGTSALGDIALPNELYGVFVFSSVNSEIGGTDPAFRNLISGNGSSGIEIAGNSPGTEVIGNYIGTDVTGMSAVPNQVGVRITSDDVTIGAPGATGGNLISGNELSGISILDASDVLVINNGIGVDAEGEPTLGNTTGILLSNGAQFATIGSTQIAGLGNEIAGNAQNGVNLFSDATTIGNSIRANSIYDNGWLGIALDGGGSTPTPNDPGDADEGPNRLQNFPEIESATQDGEAPIDVAYFVPTDPANATYPIEVDVYLASEDDEGRTRIGGDTFEASDHAAGVPKTASFFVLSTGGPLRLVATATDAMGNTSEFSPAVTVPEPGAAALVALATLASLARPRAG